MNGWIIVAAIASMCGVLATLAGAIFVYGQLTQSVRDNAKRTEKHEERLGDLDTLVNGHAVAIARLDTWNAGYEAAAKSNAGAHRA